MGRYLGIDTSNYTTSFAWLDTETGECRQVKRLLPVREGELGLRQSDAVFHHVRQLPELMEELAREADLTTLSAIGVSERPTEADDSYMPCFLAGLSAARMLSALCGAPLFRGTHQQGHVAAALYGAGCLAYRRTGCLAFHVSGGTTDALLVQPADGGAISCRKVAGSLDLKAGQLIDRVGLLLGLPFPAGPALEQLAGTSPRRFTVKPSLEGAQCHLSGVENQCRRHREAGMEPAEVAQFCIDSVLSALCGMTQALRRAYPGLPLVYAGGVMSNGYLRQELTERFGGRFAPPAFSADNAVGAAVLAAWRREGDKAFGTA